jgi:hypothetical protein
MTVERTELHQEVVDALLASKAFDFEAIGTVLGGYAERAARSGIDIGIIVGRRVLNYCIPPEPYLPSEVGKVQQQG